MSDASSHGLFLKTYDTRSVLCFLSIIYCVKQPRKVINLESSARRTVMQRTVLRILVVASVLSPVVAFAQTEKTKPTTATYIMKEEIELGQQQ